jgi:hypothetical protein
MPSFLIVRPSSQFKVGEEDSIAIVANEIQKLNDTIGWDDIIMYGGCRHTILNENMQQWRRDALTFLA